jgi:flagellar export protein FliJ
MRRFRFNLEKILDLRAKEEEQIRGEFKAAMAQVRAIEEEMEILENLRRETERDLLKERCQSTMKVARILVYEQGLARLVQEKDRSRQRLVAAEEAAERIRVRLNEAKRRHESLEKMKSRHRRRYDAAVRTEERKTLDEVAVNRFVTQDPGE